MERYICPIDGCTRTFDDPKALTGHVAKEAKQDIAHKKQRDSLKHNLEWYAENCEDEDQSTLF